MHAIQEITETIIRENINRAVTEVFKTMLGREARLAATTTQGGDGVIAPFSNDPGSSIPQVVGTVGFIGDINGLIYLHFPEPFARACTCQMLGMSEAELEEAGDETINDAIGEITNMTVGAFKNCLCDSGFPCKLTIPSILRGSNFCIEPISSTQRYAFSFAAADQKIVADILLKTDD
jgi:chemotaxis protein CheX